MAYASKKSNFLYLTIGIVVLLFFGAISDQFSGFIGHQLVQVFSVINIAVGIYGFRSKKMWFHSNLALSLWIVGIFIIGVLLEFLQLYSLHLFLLLCFYLWAIWLAGRQVLFSGAINMNEIIGAICIYLLMGMIWALMYLFVAQIIPGAFNGVPQVIWYDNFADVVYYSFVTLTTLGYGDISPVAPIARFLVYMEAVVGVFYMAILVASLIGARVSEPRHHKND